MSELGTQVCESVTQNHVKANTLVKKRNSSPFHLQILKLPEGVQGGHGVRWNTHNYLMLKVNYTGQKKFLLIFFKIQVEQARSFFFEGV